MKSTRREFLCAAAVAAAGGVEKKKDVRLRIAVMSDNQLRPERDNWGWYTLDRALEMLRPMDADIVLNAGDISDFDDIPTIGRYLAACRAKLGGARNFAVPGLFQYIRLEPGFRASLYSGPQSRDKEIRASRDLLLPRVG